MDAAMLARVLSKMQDHVEEAAATLKKVANDNLSPDNTLAVVDLNIALLEVDAIATDLGQLLFQVDDALHITIVPNHVALPDSSSVAVEDEASGSMDNDGYDVLCFE